MAKERFAERAAKQRDAVISRSLLVCFNEHGCFETTLDQVAAEVGIGKGTSYRLTIYGKISSRPLSGPVLKP